MNGIARVVLTITLLVAAEPAAGQASSRKAGPGPFNQSFMMVETEDGTKLDREFEIWTVSGDFRTSGAKPSCTIEAVSFIEMGDWTGVNSWHHEAISISEVRPRVFKVNLTGRLNPFSGLEAVLEFSPDGNRIVDLSGSMRAGTRGQSVDVYHIDRDAAVRKVLPIRNPSRGLEGGT